ncbi:MAG: hypothetical protein CM15mL3_1080 [Kanaloavirus sp.]|nr:MAG: hypothetical protein CM15mL3_1080 [Kanaloavirus sp.]
MKKYLSILLILLGGSAVHAGGLSTRHQSSLQLTVDAARTIQTRVGNSYSISGTNVNTSHTVGTGNDAVTTTGGLGVNSYSDKGVASVGTVAVTQSQGCSTTGGTTSCTGGSFSFSQSFTQGDAIDGTSTTWGDITTYTQGSAGTGVPGTIDNAHTITLSQGTSGNPNLGAGNSLTGQFVSEITIFD